MPKDTTNLHEGKRVPDYTALQRVSKRDVLLNTDWLNKQEILIMGKCNNLLIERESLME